MQQVLLQSLQSVAIAEISLAGDLISANHGFYGLLQLAPDSVVDHVGPYINNPSFTELAAGAQRAMPGQVIYQGLITFLGELGAPRSLLARVCRQGDHLAMIAEHDVRENENLLAAVMGLNEELAEQQRVLARANWQLAAEKAEQQRLLQELAAAQAQLVQSAQLASVGQLAAGVAHEVNNPISFLRTNVATLGGYVGDLLAIIDAYAGGEALLAQAPSLLARIHVLRERCDLDFVRGDAVAVVAESAAGIARVARIVSDLKNFARINESEWQVADLHACLESTLNVASHELRGSAEVVRQYGPLPALHCCPSQLNQVFMNLLLNAIQSLDEAGNGPGKIFLRTGRQDDQGWIEIEDNGRGIAPEKLPRIFEPFYTTRAIGAGTGLGLSSAWGIINSHGGWIEVRSEVGKGSTFRIWLPLSRTTSE
jgi:two-component system NtrC family sensor kinase